MLASATLTTVLSRKVRKSRVHSTASATGRRRQAAPCGAAGMATASATGLAPARGGDEVALAGIGEVREGAERARGNLAAPADVDGGPLEALSERLAAEQDGVRHGRMVRRLQGDRADGRRCLEHKRAERRLGLRGHEGGELLAVLKQ